MKKILIVLALILSVPFLGQTAEITDGLVLYMPLDEGTGKTVKEISLALERDKFMTAEEAKEFGLIDSVVEKRK